MTDLTIEYRPIDALRPYPKNARTHSRKQVRQIAASITEFGFTNPALIDDDGMILAGHGRVEAARHLGMATVPCVQMSSMTQAQKRAYVLADNKLALNAGWDEDLLAEELGSLMDEDIGFDAELTGFSIAEIDSLIEAPRPEEPGDPDDDRVPDEADVPARCRPGDIWQLGPHRLICGDARDDAVIAALMADERARMVFTDPPYNVPVDGHVGGLGKTRHREFAMASGEMSSAAFATFLTDALRPLAGHAVNGSIHFICMDWRHMGGHCQSKRLLRG